MSKWKSTGDIDKEDIPTFLTEDTKHTKKKSKNRTHLNYTTRKQNIITITSFINTANTNCGCMIVFVM